jgi:hypothetical protein
VLGQLEHKRDATALQHQQIAALCHTASMTSLCLKAS